MIRLCHGENPKVYSIDGLNPAEAYAELAKLAKKIDAEGKYIGAVVPYYADLDFGLTVYIGG